MPNLFPHRAGPLRRLGALALVLLLGLAACDSGPTANGPAPTAVAAVNNTGAAAANPGGAATAVINVTLLEWSISLNQATVPAGAVHFTVTNGGRMEHNLTVEGASGVLGKTATFSPSAGPQTLDLTLAPGTYTLMCSLPGHAQRGQQTTLTVK
jgi:uncharacterized cupredoxin-like copper-binding protein